jgi:adenine-specific DNA methylase
MANRVVEQIDKRIESLDRKLAALEIPHDAATQVPDSITTALEEPSFPFERLSEIAEIESWRKEINRPPAHIHKWWAQRLGSVFRAILLSAFSPPGTNILEVFYRKRATSEEIVFHPFMGSGTTVGEAIKLGFRAIGQDINPVSHFLVQNAFAAHSRADIMTEFEAMEADTAPAIRHYYEAQVSVGLFETGLPADVLYYFWVKVLSCPECGSDVDLFSSRVFSQHAYPKKYPSCRAVCPDCGAINTVNHGDTKATCSECGKGYNPQEGPAKGQTATCPKCRKLFPIAKTVKATRTPPRHRMYAKMVLLPDGEKQYLRSTPEDVALYAEAEQELQKRKDAYPVVPIEAGYNTNQALGYNYTHWHLMFNSRQLLCLSILADRIRRIEQPQTRELFTCLLSGCLEFNNMFASFKGEGTGAVRHMFSHHIFKPERTPLEANIWGTPKSSGAFSTLFQSRILRALDYQTSPFEIRPVRQGSRVVGEKVYDSSLPLAADMADTYAAFAKGNRLYLACGSSAKTDLPDESVNAVVTDPPFFDNVHYSQLADFFHVWQRHFLGARGVRARQTTRSEEEVQHGEAETFGNRLGAVWRECHRVLRDDGLLVFTYHHSKPEGWRCVLQALADADFRITAVHPIKAEMSVATPKAQAREPIDYDIIIVCRKRVKGGVVPPMEFRTVLQEAMRDAKGQVARLRASKRPLSRNDARIILLAQVLLRLSNQPVTSGDPIREHETELEEAIRSVYGESE